MVYSTLGLVFTATADMLGATSLYRSKMPQDSSRAVQEAAPPSAQQCLQALVDAGM